MRVLCEGQSLLAGTAIPCMQRSSLNPENVRYARNACTDKDSLLDPEPCLLSFPSAAPTFLVSLTTYYTLSLSPRLAGAIHLLSLIYPFFMPKKLDVVFIYRVLGAIPLKSFG